MRQKDLIHKISDFAIKKKTLFFLIDNFKNLGVDNCDIYGYYKLSLNEWFDKLKINFREDLKEFGFLSAFFLIDFRLVTNEWCWTLDSMKSLDFDITKQFFREEKKIYDMKVFEKKLQNITEIERINYLNKYYEKLSDALWISKSDKTVFVCDESVFGFDLENGWSKQKIGEILEMWFFLINNVKITSKIRGD